MSSSACSTSRYREQLLPHCTNPDVLTFWTVTFPSQGEQQRTSLHALLRRFSQLLTTETTRYMVSQPASRLNLLDAIEGQQIVLAPLPHVTLGDLASAIGMLLLQQFVRAAFARPGTDQTRHTYPLIIDELQVFIGKDGDSTDIQNAITQLRGLGIAGIYAHQTLDQLGALKDEMLTNSGSRLILRTQEPDASAYAKLYAASGITRKRHRRTGRQRASICGAAMRRRAHRSVLDDGPALAHSRCPSRSTVSRLTTGRRACHPTRPTRRRTPSC